MTDKPTTLSLDSTEWRGLLSQNLVRAHEFVQQQGQAINLDGVKALHNHLERMKALVTAWHLSQPAPAAEPQTKQVVHDIRNVPPVKQEADSNVVNGATEPKRRGGWPKGKKRNAPGIAQAVQ